MQICKIIIQSLPIMQNAIGFFFVQHSCKHLGSIDIVQPQSVAPSTTFNVLRWRHEQRRQATVSCWQHMAAITYHTRQPSATNRAKSTLCCTTIVPILMYWVQLYLNCEIWNIGHMARLHSYSDCDDDGGGALLGATQQLSQVIHVNMPNTCTAYSLKTLMASSLFLQPIAKSAKEKLTWTRQHCLGI